MAYFPYEGRSVFYEEFGQGSPVLFLHGNTASSRMFELLMPLYAEKFRCILLDFLGNGRSDRVERFSPDLWQEEARQTIALAEHLQCGKSVAGGGPADHRAGGVFTVRQGLPRGDKRRGLGGCKRGLAPSGPVLRGGGRQL